MTSKRSLGPILALIGGTVVLGAVIGGVIAVGGPGDARAQRFDSMRHNTMLNIANAAQCAYLVAGVAPATIEEAERAAAAGLAKSPPVACYSRSWGATDAQMKKIDYHLRGPDAFEICADFLRPSKPSPYERTWDQPPELSEPRLSAGRHCYKIPFVSAAAPASDPGGVAVTEP